APPTATARSGRGIGRVRMTVRGKWGICLAAAVALGAASAACGSDGGKSRVLQQGVTVITPVENGASCEEICFTISNSDSDISFVAYDSAACPESIVSAELFVGDEPNGMPVATDPPCDEGLASGPACNVPFTYGDSVCKFEDLENS